MSRDFDGTNYLSVAQVSVTAAPLTFGGWYYNDTVATSVNMLSLGASGSLQRFLMWYNTSGDVVNWTANAGSGSKTATTTSSISANTWHHVCGVEYATDSRAILLDGGNKGTNATAAAPASIARTTLGALGTTSFFTPMLGRLAEFGLWNAALTDEEIASLAAGFSPLAIRPESLVSYWPLGGLHGETDNDLVGGVDLTPLNSPVWAEHPSGLFYPGSAIVVPGSAAAPPTTTRRKLLLLGAA